MMRSSTPRNDEAPRGGNRARPEHIRNVLTAAAYRTAHLSAPAALALLLLAAALLAGGAA